MAQVKRIRRNVSGIILLDKPLGFTSNAALQKVRWLLNAEKAGHTGSLDPLATGVLPLCFGEATKFSQYLLDSDKGYETLVVPTSRRCCPVFVARSARYRQCTRRSSVTASHCTNWLVLER